jgi:integrase
MAIYQRGENWYIDFTFKGRRIRESIGPSRQGAEKVIAKRKSQIAENKYLDVRKDPDPILFHDFCKEYLKWSEANKKPSTVIREKSSLRLWDKEFEGKTLQEITAWSVDKWKLKVKERLTGNTVKRYLALLKHVFSKAMEQGKIKEDSLKSVKLPKNLNERLRFLLPDEIQILLSTCHERIKPMVIVALHTGMRRGETLSLKKEQIDMERGFITLSETKNDKKRNIPMDETVKALTLT